MSGPQINRDQLRAILNDEHYLKFAYSLRKTVKGLRRRSLVAGINRLMQLSGVEECVGVEVGVKFGTLSQQLLESIPGITQMVLVDPWKEFPADHPDREHFNYAGRSQKGWDDMARLCQERMKPFGGRAEIMRMKSLEAAEEFACDTLDWLKGRPFFVYVDAGHSYEDVLADCRAWWEILAPGGVLCGDDYQPEGAHDRRDSVSIAVEEFAQDVEQPLVGLHRNFFIPKPK